MNGREKQGGISTEDRATTLCPKCGGQGHVAKPPWVPGDVDHWPAVSTGGYTCRVCEGRGYMR